MGITVRHTREYASGRVIYRRAIPAELRAFVSKREHKVPLGRAGEAGLLSRWEAAEAEYGALIVKAPRQQDGTFDRLDAPMIAYIAKRFEMDWHREEEKSLAAEGADWAEKRR
jgi:hypothetical protein